MTKEGLKTAAKVALALAVIGQVAVAAAHEIARLVGWECCYYDPDRMPSELEMAMARWPMEIRESRDLSASTDPATQAKGERIRADAIKQMIAFGMGHEAIRNVFWHAAHQCQLDREEQALRLTMSEERREAYDAALADCLRTRH